MKKWIFIKQKQTHRLQKQIYSYLRGREKGKERQGDKWVILPRCYTILQKLYNFVHWEVNKSFSEGMITFFNPPYQCIWSINEILLFFMINECLENDYLIVLCWVFWIQRAFLIIFVVLSQYCTQMEVKKYATVFFEITLNILFNFALEKKGRILYWLFGFTKYYFWLYKAGILHKD